MSGQPETEVGRVHLPAETTSLFDAMAETQVIGSVLARKGAIDEVVDSGVSGASFYKPAHETIFNTILDMHAEGRGIDAITVGEEMLRRGSLEMSGGLAYLHQCVSSVPTTWNVGHYADIVRERWILREFYYSSLRMQQMATVDGVGSDISDVLTRARSLLDELIDLNVGHLANEDDVLDDVIAALSGPRNYVATPWRALNAAIGGWRPGNLFVIGARPSVGKTAVAGNIFRDAMRRGLFPILFSLEMPKDEILARIMSDIGNVDGTRMLHHSLRGDDEANLAIAAEELRRFRYLIDDRSRLSLAQMRATIRSVQRMGMPVLPVIDYLQIIKPSDERVDRRVQVDAIAQGLKDMAKDLNVPVITLAQLNREAEGRAQPEPTMRDLREAGGIEQAADTIALLHRDTADPVAQRTLHFLIAKARHGRVCRFETLFEGEYSRVSDMNNFGA
jgi:replicative DNA helicase